MNERNLEQFIPAVTKAGLAKTPTGIRGFDELTFGGLPTGRPSLVCGRAGSGKTLFAMTFLVNGVTMFNEPGVFMSFEETSADLAKNVTSLGVDIPALISSGKLVMDHVVLERSEIEENGDYDLEGLFVRLGYAIRSVDARRVVLDTIETLFAGLGNTAILRSELRRLFAWLKEQGVTAVITAEQGKGELTRHGLEEYVSDCVILLDNRVSNQVTTRRLRVVKYRGSAHGADEYPFLIDANGIQVLPVTSAMLDHPASEQKVPSGVAGLDAMLGGGFFRGSSVLVSGAAGTGKTSLAAHFVDAACRRGEHCIYFAYEEAPRQILRNMRAIGIDLVPWLENGLLLLEAARPTLYGLEMHLVRIQCDIERIRPDVVVLDPTSSLRGDPADLHAMLLRLIDMLKAQGITTLMTNLVTDETEANNTRQCISSLIDTWLSLSNIPNNGERNRALYVLKARGMKNSNQIREFLLTDQGIHLVAPYLGPAGVLTGSARLAQEAVERNAARQHDQELDRRRRGIARRRTALERQIADLQLEIEELKENLVRMDKQEVTRGQDLATDRVAMANQRGDRP
ncbi:circadian clock protein KaiC [Rhodovastum atsumiense]|uniref:non-specific serine/threonine protein kinase n=1 Tax=Rhodovastum atsumiense TaxID=504468 RepID=A0A5M6IRP6_9PROT|nr:circadian clock protein KaiC [Rhodovastum atsumiense]KAA5610861.1 KaiC family protein [Rhodovastum atsumiense]